MAALQHLVLESVRRLSEASADEIREYVGQLMGHYVLDERVEAASQGLMEKQLLSCSEDASGDTIVRSYRLTSGGQLSIPASRS